METDWQPIYSCGRDKKEDLIDYAVMTSLSDATPEGKSVVELGKTMGTRMEESVADQVEFVGIHCSVKDERCQSGRWHTNPERCL